METTVTADHYEKAGKKYARVTSIVRFAYPDAFDGIPEGDREFYFQRGTENHRAWQMVEEGTADGYEFDSRVQAYLPAHAKFLKDTGFRALPGGIEVRVFNEAFGYAGTVDRIGTVGNRIWLLDYKTTQVKDKCAALQTALYLLATQYRFPEVERYGVAFRKDGTYRMTIRFPDSDKNDAVYYAKKFMEAK
jgi:hypothetical protein